MTSYSPPDRAPQLLGLIEEELAQGVTPLAPLDPTALAARPTPPRVPMLLGLPGATGEPDPQRRRRLRLLAAVSVAFGLGCAAAAGLWVSAEREQVDLAQAGEEHSWRRLRGLRGSAASLTVTTDPPDAIVFIDGVQEKSALHRSGTAPMLAANVDQKVSVKRAGYRDLDLTVRLARGEKRELSLHLEPLATAADPSGAAPLPADPVTAPLPAPAVPSPAPAAP